MTHRMTRRGILWLPLLAACLPEEDGRWGSRGDLKGWFTGPFVNPYGYTVEAGIYTIKWCWVASRKWVAFIDGMHRDGTVFCSAVSGFRTAKEAQGYIDKHRYDFRPPESMVRTIRRAA